MLYCTYDFHQNQGTLYFQDDHNLILNHQFSLFYSNLRLESSHMDNILLQKYHQMFVVTRQMSNTLLLKTLSIGNILQESYPRAPAPAPALPSPYTHSVLLADTPQPPACPYCRYFKLDSEHLLVQLIHYMGNKLLLGNAFPHIYHPLYLYYRLKKQLCIFVPK